LPTKTKSNNRKGKQPGEAVPGAAAQSPTRSDQSQRAGELTQLGTMGKAFTILEILCSQPEPLTMSEIVARTGLTKPTAHRIATMLADMGFIERDTLKRGYIEGPRLIKLSLDILTAAAPRNMRHAILRSVSDEIGESCNFGVLSGAEVIYIDRVEAKWPLGLRFEEGSQVPAHCTATGKLLLALLPERECRQTLASMPLAQYTRRTIVDPDKLRGAIAECARTQTGVDDQEFIDGVVCIAVPVIADNGQVAGGIAVSAPEARVNMEQLHEFLPTMRRAAVQLGKTYRFKEDPD